MRNVGTTLSRSNNCKQTKTQKGLNLNWIYIWKYMTIYIVIVVLRGQVLEPRNDYNLPVKITWNRRIFTSSEVW